jgi:ABC-type uncharacterized transport system substrate-binding protein
MKKCRVAILMGVNNQFHCTVANAIMKVLSNNGEFHVTPVVVSLTQNAISSKLIQRMNDFDVFIAIGQRGSVFLKEASKDLVDGPQILFVGIPDPVALNLIDSLEVPGNNVSAVIRHAAQPLDVAQKLVPFLPYLNKIIIPYWPAGEAGQMKQQVTLMGEYFQNLGMRVEPIEVLEKEEILEVLKAKVERQDLVLFLEGGTNDTYREIIYLCWDRDALVCGDSNEAIINGAACSFGGNLYKFAEEVERVLMLFWADGKQLGLVPVVPLPNDRIFTINVAMLRMVGFSEEAISSIVEALPEALILKKWVSCPL